jgi:tetratricopeptide (TPR) repeat protein/predicted Ser/Thr protein kinase
MVFEHPPSPGPGDEAAALTAPMRGPGVVRRQRRGPNAAPEAADPLGDGDQSSIPATPLEPLPPPYINKGELGRGGMGVVYRAYEPPADRDVAIKFLPPSNNNKDQARRFQREARELAGLSHPNIVAFYTFGLYRGRDFLVMELVDGDNLATLLHDRDELMPMAEVCSLFAQISDGLGHIHAQGVVHRDLKPANILISLDGTPKISDFGLARSMEDRSQLTSTGAIVGTISYLSPEQIVSSAVGPSADLYSLGTCLYEAVIGHPPFSADTEFGMLNKHLKETPVSPATLRPEVPPELDSLILRMLKKSPTDRPQSAEEVARQLRAIRTRMSIPTTPTALGRLLGREELLGQLLQRCSGVRTGEGTACLLTGLAGNGRSVVVRALFQRLKQSGVRLLLVTPEFQHTMPLRELYGSLGGQSDAFTQRLEVAGPMGAMLLLADALGKSGQPTLLVADDPERLPETTREQLECLAQLEPPRNGGWLISTSLPMKTHPKCHRVALPPMAESDLLELAKLRLGHPLEPAFGHELLSRVAGSPRQLALTVLTLQGERSLRLENELMRADSWPADPLNAVLHEFGRGEEADLKLLRAAALVGPLFPFNVALQAAGLSELDAETSLSRLLASGVWEEVWNHQDEQYSFASEPVRKALADSLAERAKKRMHVRLAGIFEERRQFGLAGEHQLAASMPAEGVPNLIAGAEHFHRQGDYPEAIRLWTRADGQSDDLQVRWKIWAGLADSLWAERRLDVIRVSIEPHLEGAPPEVRQYAARVAAVVARARPPEQRADLCRSWMPVSPELCIPLAESLELESRYSEALDALQCSNRPPSYWPVAGRLLAALGRKEEAQALFRQALDKQDQLSFPESYRLWSDLARLTGAAEAEQLLKRSNELATRVGDTRWQVSSLIEWSRLGETEARLSRAVEVARQGPPATLAEALLALGEWQLGQDRLESAESSLHEAAALEVGALAGRAKSSLAALMAQGNRFTQAASLLEAAVPLIRWQSCAQALLLACRARSGSSSPVPPMPPEGVPAGSYEEAIALAVRGMWGQADERQRAAELLPQAPSMLYGDPLRAWRGWLLAAINTPSKPVVPVAVVVAEEPIFVETPPRRSRSGVGLAAAAVVVAVIGTGFVLTHRPAASITPTSTPSPIAVETPVTPPVVTPSVTPSSTMTPGVSATPHLTAASVAMNTMAGALGTTVATRPVKFLVQPLPAWLTVDKGEKQKLTGALTLSLKPGPHRIELTKKGFQPTDDPFVVLQDQTTRPFRKRLTRLPATLSISADPSGATVKVDGLEPSQSGDDPMVIKDLRPGPHKILVTLRGYLSRKESFPLVSGQNKSVQITLEPIPPPSAPRPVYHPVVIQPSITPVHHSVHTSRPNEF